MTSSPDSDLRSNLSRAKGMGAAHHGVHHWWMQRVTAIALVPLSLWFVYELLNAMLNLGPYYVRGWFGNPLNASLLLLMLIAMFYHGKLGLQVVIEDYVKHPVAKYALLLGNTFFCIALGVVSVLAVIRLHIGIVG